MSATSSRLLRLLRHAACHRPRVAAATACSALVGAGGLFAALWRVQTGEAAAGRDRVGEP